MATVGGLTLIMLAFICYLLPALISCERHTKHFDAILFTNLVFGWTIIGWIAVLIWAIVEAPPEAKGAPPLPLSAQPLPEERQLRLHGWLGETG